MSVSEGNPGHQHDGPDFDGHVWRANEANTRARCRLCFTEMTDAGAMQACAKAAGDIADVTVADFAPTVSGKPAMVVRTDDWTDMQALHTECRALVRAADKGAIPGNIAAELAAIRKRVGLA